MDTAQLEAMVGAHLGKMSGLVCELSEELVDFAKDFLRFAAECPETRPAADYVGTCVLTAAVEIEAALRKLAAHMQRRAEADRAAHGPGGPA
jgi:hypothetical protein